MEYNFNNEKAGKPYPKTSSALEVCLILSLSKDPYPNKQEMICSEPIISPAAAGAERKSESSTDLFVKILQSCLICFLSFLIKPVI